MNVTERASSSDLQGEDVKRLITVAKDLEEILLEYASTKPVKKVFKNNGEAKEVPKDDKTNKVRDFIDKIFEFK